MNKLIHDYAMWLETVGGRQATTSNIYTSYLKKLENFLKEDTGVDILEADRLDLESFCGQWAHQQGMTPRSRRPLIASVRGFYKWLFEYEYREDNPAKSLSYPKAGKPLPVMMGRKNAEGLLKSCDLSTFVGARDAAMLALLISTGLRVSGLASLNQEQFYTVEDETTGHPVVMLRVMEKGKKERVVPVDEVAVLPLKIYLQHKELIALQKERLLNDGDHLMWVQIQRGICPEHDWMGENRRLSAGAIQRMIVRRGARCGIPRHELHPHAIRHLFGTELAESDVPLQRIQMLMGHADPQTTAVYIQLSGRKNAEIINQFSPLAKMSTPFHALRDQINRKRPIRLK